MLRTKVYNDGSLPNVMASEVFKGIYTYDSPNSRKKNGTSACCCLLFLFLYYALINISLTLFVTTYHHICEKMFESTTRKRFQVANYYAIVSVFHSTYKFEKTIYISFQSSA